MLNESLNVYSFDEFYFVCKVVIYLVLDGRCLNLIVYKVEGDRIGFIYVYVN